MIAVADTSPICYLVLIGEIELLPALFTEVIIPPGVAAELSDPRAPAAVGSWWREPPPWIRITDPGSEKAPEAVRRLHRGEREAILLARYLAADVILLDEKAARHAAKTLGLRVMGLIGILASASAQERVDVVQAVERLRRTNFRISPALLRHLLERTSERSWDGTLKASPNGEPEKDDRSD